MINLISIIIRSIKYSDNQIDNIKFTGNGYIKWKNLKEDLVDDEIISKEFRYLYENHLKPSRNMLEMLCSCLADQKFKDFETILVHRYAEKLDLSILREWKEKINLSLIKPKHTHWYDMGPNYSDLANNTNTGIIWSNGNCIHSMNDEFLIGKTYTEEIAKLYKFKKLGVAKRSYYWLLGGKDPEMIYKDHKIEPIWGYEEFNKQVYILNLFPNIYRKKHAPCAWWGHAMTFDLEDALKINGFNEALDGWVDVDDKDFGIRYDSLNGEYTTAMMNNTVYSLSIPHWFHGVEVKRKRIGNKFLEILYKNGIVIIANKEKVKKAIVDEYVNWHISNYGEESLDINGIYGSCDLEIFDLRALRNIREKSEKLCGKKLI